MKKGAIRDMYTLDEHQKELYVEWVDEVEYKKLGQKTTVALATLTNGFEIIGTSACVDPNNFNQAIGEHFALIDVLRKLDELVGFYRQSQA